MTQFIQPPQQKFQRSQSSSSGQGQTPQKPGCSQFLFILALLMLMNFLFLRACAPEEKTDSNDDSSLRQVLEDVDSREMPVTEKIDVTQPETAQPEVAPTEVTQPETAPAEVSPIEVAPTEVAQPETVPAETAQPETVPAETAQPEAAPAETTAPTDEAKAPEEAMERPNSGPVSSLAIGSADPASEYRMLVTFSTRGAAVTRVELNEKRLTSMSEGKDFQGGYLGMLSGNLETESQNGCLVEVVGEGTPAKKAGILVGDRIVKVNDQAVASALDLTKRIQAFRPGQKVTLGVIRNAQELNVEVELIREPVCVIRPECESAETLSLDEALQESADLRVHNASFLTTLYSFDEQSLSKLDLEVKKRIAKDDFPLLNQFLNREILGFDMHTASWTVEAATQDSVTFLYEMPVYGLQIRKTYTLTRVADEKQKKDEASKTYHLTLNVAIKNVGQNERKLSVQQDGPTGLLTEGHWFCSKAGRGWGTTGIRDVLIGYEGNSTPNVYTCSNVADGKWGKHILCGQKPLKYIGVDAQYFSSILIPDAEKSSFAIERFVPLRVGNVPKPWYQMTDTSCRLITTPKIIKPGEEASQQFTIFVGPKRPQLLSQYELDNVVYYGWFSWIARILVGTLHFFYSLVGNYGIAILLLTALVRLMMFPLSKKQILSSIIMQKMQPEMKRIAEKFTDPMERQKAQMLLFKKYKYNPMSGCWVMLIQLPIFIALYRALLVDVELRQAPLFSESIRFCSNLVAPDMFWCWEDYVFTTISTGYGMFGLGPYFNLLPIVTILIFLVQQKIMMPPAIDDQAKMQQNMMKFMMLFMGFIFFKVPCGLCIYFIISSLWGLLERKFMPSAEDYQLSETGIIDMHVNNGTASSVSQTPQKEGFFKRIMKKVEDLQNAVEAHDAAKEREKNEVRKAKKKNRR